MGFLQFCPQFQDFQLFQWMKASVNNSREECIDLPLWAASVEMDPDYQSHPEVRRDCWMKSAPAEVTAESDLFITRTLQRVSGGFVLWDGSDVS